MSEGTTPVPDGPDQDPEHVDTGDERVDLGFSETAHSGYGEDLAEADARQAQGGGASARLEDAPDEGSAPER